MVITIRLYNDNRQIFMLKNTYHNTLLFLVLPCRTSLVLVPWILCIGGFVLSLMLYYPGTPVMLMLHEARAGVYADWHPPMMAATIRCLFALCPNERTGLGVLLLMENLLFWTGLLLVLLNGKQFWINNPPKKLWVVAPPLLILFALWMDVMTMTRYLSKDFLHVACLFLATGLLLNLPNKIIGRLLVCLFVLLLLFYSTALRYNAVLGLLPMLYWLCYSMIPTKRIVLLVSAGLLWGSFFLDNHTINYHVRHAYRF
jgi:hypothetical protein